MALVQLAALWLGLAHAAGNYTDFTGIWDGTCVNARGSQNVRVVIIMDNDADLQLGSIHYKLPEDHTETTEGEDGDPMSPEKYTEVRHVSNAWNASKTEIDLDTSWTDTPEGTSRSVDGYSRIHLRMVGPSLEIVEQDTSMTDVCTYHRR